MLERVVTGYHLEPEGSADVYYHGKHELPPQKITRNLLAETRLLFDPTGVDNRLVYANALPLFETAMKPSWGYPLETLALAKASVNGGATEGIASETGEKADAEAEAVGAEARKGTMSEAMRATLPVPLTTEEWETDLIATFSNACDGRIARRRDPKTGSATAGTPPINPTSMAQDHLVEHARIVATTQHQQQFQQNQTYWR